MTVLRIFLSIALFIAAILALVGLLLNGFSWLYVAIAVGGFLLAAWVWPSRREPDTRRNEYSSIEWLELLIEFPAELILWPLRWLGMAIRHGLD